MATCEAHSWNEVKTCCLSIRAWIFQEVWSFSRYEQKLECIISEEDSKETPCLTNWSILENNTENLCCTWVVNYMCHKCKTMDIHEGMEIKKK